MRIPDFKYKIQSKKYRFIMDTVFRGYNDWLK